MTSRTLVLGVLMVVLVAVTGCGRRGPLEAPVGASTAPRPAASERIAAPFAQATTPDADFDDPNQLSNPQARSGQTRQVQVAPTPVDPNKPDRPFFLDPLVK